MSLLEKSTHILMILVCCLSLFVLGRQVLRKPAPVLGQNAFTSTVVATPQSKVGGHLTVAGIDWGRSPVNVVLAIRSGCQYCEASLPLYRELSKVKQKSGDKISLAVVSSDSPGVIQAFLAKADLQADQAVQTPLASLGVPGTPTVFVVDSQGTIKRRMVGKLSSSDEKILLAALVTGPERKDAIQ